MSAYRVGAPRNVVRYRVHPPCDHIAAFLCVSCLEGHNPRCAQLYEPLLRHYLTSAHIHVVRCLYAYQGFFSCFTIG